ncbi:FAD binding domain-containing protein [Marinitenerispora sediminis]|uniref:Molybdopterin dehydrogenase n=1 Tax=Marinitenerispora sediminis TaxID=1931232 RepID=A0A368T1R6_9ACTN|nr:xanthine dehydrogenase family protein subunit M [Marinitenerispora sediminis]RCV53291.1 molybdopterin dehydrogenase [Marinitenerispora sediminis]RCV54477.1 molybdopterin dehydrogenase [Marinitenerispora sediminis]RCV58507.1 molybdopterin dehydrogenase [Marinitenerispora sediminis]
MKPPAFRYHAPASLAETLATLAEVGARGKVLAGGQSLVPLMNMRLAAPEHIVDINGVAGLDDVTVDAGGVRIGALVRHARLEADAEAAAAVPLLRQGLRLVAHPVIRNRGTTVGSIAHADPSAEMPAALALLGGSVEAAGAAGRRTVPAAEFFTGPMESCLRPDELAVSAHFPRPEPGTGSAFTEVARRHGDYALCGVAALVTLDADLRITAARAGYLSVSPTPAVLDLTDAVAGRTPDTADLAAAGRLAVGRLEPEDDIHATAEYRAHLAGVLTVRALRAAAEDALARATRDPRPAGSGSGR